VLAAKVSAAKSAVAYYALCQRVALDGRVFFVVAGWFSRRHLGFGSFGNLSMTQRGEGRVYGEQEEREA